jgi:hypothetical protein
MNRSKRTMIRRIALGLAVAAAVIPATAQARVLDLSASDARAIHEASLQQQSVEIPYLSHGVGVDARQFEPALGPDDRSFSRKAESTATRRMEIPYLSHGVGVSPSDFGQPLGVDDRPLSRQTEARPVTVTGSGGDGYNVDSNTVGGLVLILAAAGAALAIRHNRKTKLSPA